MRTALHWLWPSGRTSRGRFLVAFVLLLLAGYVLVSGVDATLGELAGTLLVAILTWLGVCLAGRRLHDIGRSAWWLLAFFVPVVGALWLAWLLFLRRGSEGENRYGPDPLQRAADYLTVA